MATDRQVRVLQEMCEERQLGDRSELDIIEQFLGIDDIDSFADLDHDDVSQLMDELKGYQGPTSVGG